MPSLIIIAGPNGAGKTTFADEYLSAEERRFEFVNADEIGRASEDPSAPRRSDILAARMMLRRIDELVRTRTDFVVETTLATRTYARRIPDWRANGYIVSLIYLRLQSIDDAIARVRKRVTAGGHDITEETIRRRFGRSFSYFETVYKSIVDEWYVWDSREGDFVLADAWNRTRP